MNLKINISAISIVCTSKTTIVASNFLQIFLPLGWLFTATPFPETFAFKPFQKLYFCRFLFCEE